MRCDRDLVRLWQGEQAGDPLGRKLFAGLGGWRCRKTPVGYGGAMSHRWANLLRSHVMPLTFLVIRSEDAADQGAGTDRSVGYADY
jgi:hypothetical protein